MNLNGARLRHGHSRKRQSPTYRSWRGMIARCFNPNADNFHKYGGRGITVCERWRLFDNFLSDMGERPPGKTLDRIDGTRGYEPGNCRWATPKEQALNSRMIRYVLIDGERMPQFEAARRLGLAQSTISERVSRGQIRRA